jgi:hypothetical protein
MNMQRSGGDAPCSGGHRGAQQRDHHSLLPNYPKLPSLLVRSALLMMPNASVPPPIAHCDDRVERMVGTPMRLELPAAPMNAELRELAILRETRQRERAASKEVADSLPAAAATLDAGGSAGSQLLLMYDDVVISILAQLCLDRDVASLLSCLASSTSLSCLSRQLLRSNFPLYELLPELLELPAHLRSHVSERCKVHLANRVLPRGNLLRGNLYPAVRKLLHGELPPDVVWLVTQQWSGALEAELSSMGDAHRQWRIGCAGLPGRSYRLGGLDDKGASDHRFLLRGEEASIASFFEHHMSQPLRRPSLPCILAGPRSNLGLIRLPIELLQFVEPDDAVTDHHAVSADHAVPADGAAAEHAAAGRPQPDAVVAMPPALRALVEYISRDNVLRPLDCD